MKILSLRLKIALTVLDSLAYKTWFHEQGFLCATRLLLLNMLDVFWYSMFVVIKEKRKGISLFKFLNVKNTVKNFGETVSLSSS